MGGAVGQYANRRHGKAIREKCESATSTHYGLRRRARPDIPEPARRVENIRDGRPLPPLHDLDIRAPRSPHSGIARSKYRHRRATNGSGKMRNPAVVAEEQPGAGEDMREIDERGGGDCLESGGKA